MTSGEKKKEKKKRKKKKKRGGGGGGGKKEKKKKKDSCVCAHSCSYYDIFPIKGVEKCSPVIVAATYVPADRCPKGGHDSGPPLHPF